MAFNQNTFAPVGSNASPSPSIYSYLTSDTFDTVTTAGYFVDKQSTLETGDVIIAVLAGVAYSLTVETDTSHADNNASISNSYTQAPSVASNGVGTETIENTSLTFQKHTLTGATRTYDFSAVDGACDKRILLTPSTGCTLTIVGAVVESGSALVLTSGAEYFLVFTCMDDNDADRFVSVKEFVV